MSAANTSLRTWAWLVVWATGCASNPPTAGEGVKDDDDDGYSAKEDCNDQNAAVYPGAPEICDGLDNNCNGEVDEDDSAQTIWYADADGDGYGSPSSTQNACDQPEGTVEDLSAGEDCDDSDAAVNPAGTEECNNGKDDDCDGTSNDCVLEGSLSLASADVRFLGEEDGDGAGQAVGFAGDLNADGTGDVVIGAPWRTIEGDTAMANAGAAYVVLGPKSGTVGLDAADAAWTGASSGARAGWAVGGGGDVNSDESDDALVGAPGDNLGGAGAGAAFLLFGPATSGGALDESGADAVLTGKNPGDGAGTSVAGGFDLNNDGVSDVLLGAPGATGDNGAVYVFFGPVQGQVSVQAANVGVTGNNSEALGTAAASAGDLNGDGKVDLLLGAPRASANNGTDVVQGGVAYAMYGPLNGSNISSATYDRRFIGDEDGDRAGLSVAGTGDVNADGYDDVLVGAPFGHSQAVQAGGAYLFLGGSDDLDRTMGTADALLLGEAANALAGLSVDSAGDLDGDG